MTRHFRNSLRLLLMAAALLGTSCGRDPVNAREGAERKIFLINNKSEPRFLDLHRCNSVAEHQIMLALFEGLVAEQRDSDREVEPGMADRWESNAEKSVWTFHIRDDAKWSDGTPFTAHDFVWSWQRMLRKDLGAEYSNMLFALKNGEALYHKKVPPEALGAEARDERTLVVTLVGPTPHFPLMLCHTSWWPVPRHVIEKHGGVSDVMNSWTDDDKMVSNGPFKMKRYLFRQYVETERNPHYWDAATVKLDGVRFYPIDREQTEELLFRRGQLHATYSTPLSRIPYYLEHHPDITHNYRNCAVGFYRINTTRGPLGDVRVRRALGMALDRESVVKNVLRGNQLPASGIVPPMDGYTGIAGFRHDPAEAQRLLREAGFPDGRGFPPLAMLIRKTETDTQMAEAVQAMWRHTLGIHISIRQQEFSVYLTTQHAMDYDIAVAGWNADYYDPATFIDMWITNGGNNETGWSHAEFDRHLADAAQCVDAARRMDILRAAEAIVLREAPVIPIYIYTRTRLIHPAVKEWTPRLLDNRLWKYMELVHPPPACSMDAELARH